jgi:signal transduction histidine kinase
VRSSVDDPGRLAALEATGLLAAAPVPSLDRLTALTARLVRADAALVSLVATDRQVFAGSCGAPDSLAGGSPLSHSYCRSVVEAEAPVIITDGRTDERFRNHPLVVEGIAAAYAGFPLRDPAGFVLGSFCVLDSEPRDWIEAELSIVRDLAAAAESEVALRLAHQDQVRSAQRLDDERTFLQTLLDSLDTGVVACDGEGRPAVVNRALREAHDAGAAPISPEQWARSHALFDPDGRTPLAADQVPLARAYAGESVHGRQLVVHPPDGPARRFDVNARPIVTPDGRRLGAVAAMHDVTESHHAEVLLRGQHAAARALSEATSAEHAAAGTVAAITGALGWMCGEYWQADQEQQRIVRLSSHHEPGRDLSAFTGGTALDLGPGQGLPGLVWQRDTTVWSGDSGTARQLGIRTSIGVPVRAGRRVLGVLAFFAEDELPRDPVTVDMLETVCAHLGRFVERRRAEDLTLALAAARRDFARVVERVNDYLWTVEITADGKAQPIYASPDGTGVLGAVLPPDTDLITVLAERVHPDDRPGLAAFHTTTAASRPAELECRIHGFDGVTRWVWTRATPRSEDGRRFLDGISTNVTERREVAEQREQLFRQQQEQVGRLQELDRMKDGLVAVVSNELRDPIGVLRTYAEMLLDSTTLTTEDRHTAGVVDRTAAHLTRLVENLFDLARLDAGQITVDPQPIDAARLLAEAVDGRRADAGSKQITVTTSFDARLPVNADAERLRQVLDNLLGNAIRYTPAEGSVTVCAVAAGDQLAISVTDTGIGIPADEYPKLFGRFFRASNAARKSTKGTGLGLAVSKAIVEAHGGTITARPEPGGGTTFAVTLPAGPGPT